MKPTRGFVLPFPKFLSSSLIALFASIFYQQESDPQVQSQIAILSSLSLLGYFACIKLIPIVAEVNIKNGGLSGKDIHKPYKTERVPESLGIVVGIVYLVTVILFQPFFPTLGSYNAATTGICLMLFLGFLDDVLELRWRVKINLTFLAVLPLLVAYNGPTQIVIPKIFQSWFGLEKLLELSYFYHIYMALIAVFCTNGINIYAGVNGLEVHQSVVIAGAVLIHNLIELDGPFSSNHYLSMFLVFPFFSTSLALLYYNWFPADVFVGDSFTYFAGMTLATAGIMGHFSKTLMLFFIPQLFNFVISIPQLFGIVECPRHRLPVYNPKDGKLHPTFNLNLINAWLYVTGPLTEEALSAQLIVLQIVCCMLGFAIRYSHTITHIFYDHGYMILPNS